MGPEANLLWHVGTMRNTDLALWQPFWVHCLSHHFWGPLVSCSQLNSTLVLHWILDLFVFPLQSRSAWAGRWYCLKHNWATGKVYPEANQDGNFAQSSTEQAEGSAQTPAELAVLPGIQLCWKKGLPRANCLAFQTIPQVENLSQDSTGIGGGAHRTGHSNISWLVLVYWGVHLFVLFHVNAITRRNLLR